MVQSYSKRAEDRIGFISGLQQDALRVLVIRPDRLGDVVLSTPVLAVIKRYFSNAHLTVLVKENVVPLLKGLPSVDQVVTFDPEGRHAGLKGFYKLYTEISQGRYLVAIALQTHWKIALVLFLARIRYRVGPLSKIHSFLFYNSGVRQRRSHVEMHEADYNLQLLKKLGIRIGSRNVPTRVHVSESVQNQAQEWLKKKGWDSEKPLIVVHPGMGGSALNWPEHHYQELIRSLVLEGKQILITGGPAEHLLMDRVRDALGPVAEKIFVYKSSADTQIDFLAGLFSFAAVVVAPSTGPLHIAVALGKNVVTFYPPIRVQSALRWGPYLPDESKASILVPEVFCGQEFKCLGNLCNYYPCMKGLTLKQALKEVEKQLALFQASKEIKSDV